MASKGKGAQSASGATADNKGNLSNEHEALHAAEGVEKPAASAPKDSGKMPNDGLAVKAKRALASIDSQAPGLTYLGFGCWNTWNVVAFSGSFWLHETDNSSVAITLMLTHLVACVATLLAGALLSRRFPLALSKNRVTLAGALIAVAGTVIICCARQAVMPFANQNLAALFRFGCTLSGIGTTIVFFRGAALFGTLAPHRALYRIAQSILFSALLFFVLAACPNEVATACFVALPLAAAVLYGIRTHDVRAEREVLTATAPLSGKFGALLASIALCSMAFELLRSFILVNVPPSFSVNSTITAQLFDVVLMLVILATILLARSARDNFARIYSVATGALVLLLVAMAMFSINDPIVASITSIATTCFNLIVWAMLFYLVFQARANAILVVGLGNAALSAGTVVANLFTVAYLSSGIDADAMRVILAVLGIAVLFDVLFVFSEKQINAMLLPVDETTGDESVLPEKKHGKWKVACDELARSGGLSARETEVFMQLARGRTAQEIADREVLSIYTVRAHTRSIYAKLDVHSKKELGDRIAELAK